MGDCVGGFRSNMKLLSWVRTVFMHDLHLKNQSPWSQIVVVKRTKQCRTYRFCKFESCGFCYRNAVIFSREKFAYSCAKGEGASVDNLWVLVSTVVIKK
jgi:hypothetical protein